MPLYVLRTEVRYGVVIASPICGFACDLRGWCLFRTVFVSCIPTFISQGQV